MATSQTTGIYTTLTDAIDEALADEAAGRVVPHEVVREWLLALARGEHPPPPPA